jgi:response regulator RpfG family c-di-GMP phosphodiesterase
MNALKTSPRGERADGRPRVLSMKLILSAMTALMVAGAVMVVGMVSERSSRSLLRQETEARLVLEARNLAMASVGPLLGQFPELALCPLVREMHDRRKDLALVVVLDHEGRVAGHSDPHALGNTFTSLGAFLPENTQTPLRPDEEFRGNADLFVACAPVLHANGARLGTVVVGQRRDYLIAAQRAMRRQELGLAALLALGGGIIAVGLMRRLLRPIDVLRRGLERIGRGELDEPIRLRDRTELGQLAHTVNEMSGQLATSRREAAAKEREIVDTQAELIKTLGLVVEGRSHETANHTVRVGHAAALLARLAGLGDEKAELLRNAAPMHDVGKIGIPDAILNKPGRYEPAEFAVMKAHAELGFSILNHSERPLLKAAAIVAHEHHEKWDGSGYPRGLRGEQIHVYGRIVAIADVFDALTCHRVYRRAMDPRSALALMREGRGAHFDPSLFDIFEKHLDQFIALQERYADEPAPIVPAATICLDAPTPALQVSLT